MECRKQNKITDLFHRTSGSNLTADTAIRTSSDVKDCDYVCGVFFLNSSRTNLRIFHILKSNHACYCSSTTACLPYFFWFHLICLIFSAPLPFITPLPFFFSCKSVKDLQTGNFMFYSVWFNQMDQFDCIRTTTGDFALH